MKNPFTWVEIYVEDMPRARKFYEEVLKINMAPMQTPGNADDMEMVSFPWAEGKSNISGALCKSSYMKPGPGGALVYFASEDCTQELLRVDAAGGKVLQDKFSIGEHGFIGIAQDTEGNIIGFHSMN